MFLDFYKADSIDNVSLKYAVMVSLYQDSLVFVRNKERAGWELPAGRREPGEDIEATAARELYEETGAINFQLYRVFDYSVSINDEKQYGAVFLADITSFGLLPDYEIAEKAFFKSLPEVLTYPEIQPKLLRQLATHRDIPIEFRARLKEFILV